ncbi:hypothetical protein KC622_02900 [Candidatus Dojkabacteria bacterium]|uniref:GH18 domain-containing protein n=1 Tax=Candidatus Dojkabacteria bacterium TaxID=2099670 RepID=A0A955HZY6_9BACT|nr:hypothetical protein [Candidatus Dojkabacteria bacterium]MCB9790739.1 hypothetical protein [Candidatus Nomurabacteria bacterium]
MKNSPIIIISIAAVFIAGILYYDFMHDSTIQSAQMTESKAQGESFFTVITEPQTATDSEEPNEGQDNNAVQPQIEYELTEPVEKVEEIGWIPSWDYNRGLNSAESIADRLNSVSPVWFSVNGDGSLNDNQPASIDDIKKFCRENKILLIPTISMFDSAIIKPVLQDEEYYNRHINEIIGYVVSRDYDGIDLDYEMIELTEKQKFLNFVQTLSEELHLRGKKLSVTVLAKWNTLLYPSLNETRSVQDWKVLGQYSDQIRIMTYDLHGPGSEAGPIGPLDWQASVLERAVEEVEKNKIWLGVNLYGYQWGSDGSILALTYRQIEEVFDEYNVKGEYNKTFGEGIARYPCGDSECTIYYQTPEGISARKALAEKFGIAGVTYWRLGDENNLLKGI